MYQFTGKTEQEAIEQACAALKLDSSQFDVEILASSRRGGVQIRIYPHREESWTDEETTADNLPEWQEISEPKIWETRICDFMQKLLQRMGQDGRICLYTRSDNRLLLSIQDCSDPSVLIGRHGKHLESLQVILNAHLGRLHHEENEVPGRLRVQLDVGGYRKRRETKLLKLAKDIAAQVESRQNSRLTEALNSFERRIIHKALNDWPNISTISEGEGMYKQIRIVYRGSSH